MDQPAPPPNDSFPRILFHYEDVYVPDIQEHKAEAWILDAIKTEGKQAGDISVIFCRDEYLHRINKSYLDHDTLTDVITFDYTGEEGYVSGDIFISYERVEENAKLFNQPLPHELHRVIIHGVLHLLGYRDNTGPEKAAMHEKENYYLSLRF